MAGRNTRHCGMQDMSCSGGGAIAMLRLGHSDTWAGAMVVAVPRWWRQDGGIKGLAWLGSVTSCPRWYPAGR